MLPRKTLLLLFGLLLLQALLFGYGRDFNHLYSPPHTRRQADGYSIAVNYYYDGLDFWQPRVCNLHVPEGKAVGEFPGLYYLSAIGFHLTDGPSPQPVRIVWGLCLVFGLWGLATICWLVTRDRLFTVVLPMLFFSTPIVHHYGYGFLPDASALCFLLGGLGSLGLWMKGRGWW